MSQTGSNIHHCPTALDAALFPLHGHRLIEASAGTGKTYTITSLYLRLLTGHGSEKSKAARVLTPNDILVVTFTEAATQELRKRIRDRIHLAQQVFSGKVAPPANDPLLQKLFTDLTSHKDIAKRLLAAERQMDEASIFTIHGFCHRMLNQHAFESRTLFNLTLTTDETRLLDQAAIDFWRSTFYDASPQQAKALYQYWKTPVQLLSSLRPWLNHEDINITTYDLPDFEQRYSALSENAKQLKSLWKASQEDIMTAISKSDINRQSYKTSSLQNWKNQVDIWARSTRLSPPDCLKKFTCSALSEKTKDGGTPPDHPFFKAAETFCSLPGTFKDIFIKQALSSIKNRLTILKAQQHILGFNDLLTRLDAALQHPSNMSLRNRIRTNHPIAIIDEFQDTDPLQYRIFKTLYPQNDKAYGLLIIGDPKQAIYGFRGGDIFTYINARRAIPSRFTLPVNWRSTTAMIEACNTLFAHTPEPFIYNEDIPFSPANTAPGADLRKLQINQQTASAIMLWYQQGCEGLPVNKEQYIQCMTNATVQEIKKLLTLSEKGHCTIQNSQEECSLKANDIAILVRTGSQAKLVRSALANAGIPSVYMSERESVFNTREARDIYRLLLACLNPENESLVRSALATSLFGLNAGAISNLRENETAWEGIIEEFSEYYQCWQKQGVLSLLRQLLFKRNITQQLLTTPMGERRITDIIHVGETLSSAEQVLDSPQALVHWLWKHIQNSVNDPSFQLHLESDRNLVKIITIHKSKGLEYPVVFMPYVCDWKEVKKSRDNHGFFFHQGEKNTLTLDLTEKSTSQKQSDEERLAEDIRLFYVGVTRAVYRCYLGIAPVKKGAVGKGKTTSDLHKTAVGHLLGDKSGFDDTHLYQQLLQYWVKDSDSTIIQLSAPPVNDQAPYQTIQQNNDILSVRSFNQPIERNWRITSYSALSKGHQSSHIYERPGLEDDLLPEAHEINPPERSIFTFPKGARVGVFLHSLFEEMDFILAKHSPPSENIAKTLLHEGFESEWQETLEMLVYNVLNAPLHPESFCLGDINNHDKYAEMEFHLPLSPLDANSLNTLIKTFDPLSREAGDLSFYTVQGMLKGFIDLVFVHNNKYYVMDYKSNYLGNNVDNYYTEALTQAMIAHRYDFQYQLYTLAIHRLLKQRLPGYSYDTHIGGVFYLYLRGMQAPDKTRAYSVDIAHKTSGIFFTRPEKQLIIQLDQLFSGRDIKEKCIC